MNEAYTYNIIDLLGSKKQWLIADFMNPVQVIDNFPYRLPHICLSVKPSVGSMRITFFINFRFSIVINELLSYGKEYQT